MLTRTVASRSKQLNEGYGDVSSSFVSSTFTPPPQRQCDAAFLILGIVLMLMTLISKPPQSDPAFPG
jgi:hypothetical protein